MGQKICCGGFELGDGLELDGRTLKATGGSDVEIPEPTVGDIGKVLGVVEDSAGAKYSPVEGGSGGGMVVNVNNVTGFDKTFEEIKTAFMAGVNVIFIGGNVVLHMCELASNYLCCCGISDMTIDAENTMLEDITISRYTLNNDNTFEYEQGYASFS